MMEWIPSSKEIENFISRMTIPRVVVDNGVSPNSTVVKVDSARKDGILLEAVQVLADLDLCIKKAYISSDGRWFMDAFHVVDLNGNKLADKSVISLMEKSLGTIHNTRNLGHEGLTALELTGTDRVGLLSEVFAVLSDLQCDVVDAKVWTHNGLIASLIYIKDCCSGCEIKDSARITNIVARLKRVLKGDNDITSVKTAISVGVTHSERRLHQMMFEDRDYERRTGYDDDFESGTSEAMRFDTPVVTVQNWVEWGYSVVNVQCKDRMKLLFDVVCTLTDMDYVVFHGTINTDRNHAYLEFYIRHEDGTPINSDAEKQRVVQCLQAAIERRTSQGVMLELQTEDRPSLLADVTRTFRENGLNVTRAEIYTKDDSAANIFYVTDSEGFLPDAKMIESVREKIGLTSLNVKELPLVHNDEAEKGKDEESGGVGGAMLGSLGSIVKKNLYNLGLIKSYS